MHLKSVPSNSEAAADGFKSNDLIQSLNDQPLKTVADLLRLQNAAAGKRLDIRLVRAQTPNLIAVDHYLFATTESADADGFKTIPLAATKDVLPITALTTQPATNNEPPQTLFDGKLARNYGPVFGNGVEGGLSKVDLGQRATSRQSAPGRSIKTESAARNTSASTAARAKPIPAGTPATASSSRR